MYASERPVRQLHRDCVGDARPDHTTWPVLICVLGPFRVLQAGQPVPMRGGKTEALLCHLSLRYASGSPRTVLLETLWPDSAAALAAEALRGRVKSLHALLGAALGGAAPVLQVDGGLRLNAAAGVSVDIARCDALATTGDRQARAGDTAVAAA
jgi:DNA-binding SARP family transcriptional activator